MARSNRRRVAAARRRVPGKGKTFGPKAPPKVAHLSKPLKAAINRVVHGNIETKYVAQALQRPDGGSILNAYTGFTSGITGTSEIYACLPVLSEGTAGHQRAGEYVNPVKARVHLNIVSTQNYLKNADIMVYAFFLEAIAVKDLAGYGNIPIQQLLDNGQGSVVTFDGTSVTSLYKVNTRAFRVIKVVKKRIITNVGGGLTTSLPPVAWDHTLNHHAVTVNIPVPKRLGYASDGSLYPVNHAPFMVLGFVDNGYHGDTAPGITESVLVEGRSELWYKDA